MEPRTSTPRHPVRAVLIVTVAVALVIFVGALVAHVPGSPSPLSAFAFGLGYGLFLGAFSVGLVLLAVDLPTRLWWWAVFWFSPLLAIGPAAIGAANGADPLKGWFPIALQMLYYLSISWLLAASLLALVGWWRYIRRRGIVVDP